MALYWPEAKVALDIVDDPHRHPFEGGDDYTVLRVTCADISDHDSFDRIMRRLAQLLGKEVPNSKEWRRNNKQLHGLLAQWMVNEMPDMSDMSDTDDSDTDSEDDSFADFPFDDEFLYSLSMGAGIFDGFDSYFRDDYADFDEADATDDSDEPESYEILATSQEQADAMLAAAQHNGHSIRKVNVWEGPVPEGSFQTISENMRMSTAEYFFFRKANQLPFAEAVQLGCELCGKYRTSLTQYDASDDYDYLVRTRTSTNHIRAYLRGARGTKECKRARRVLRFVADNASSPMASYLYLRLCLSRAHGGYGLPQAAFSHVYELEDGLAPASDGPYLAYDLVWPEKHVAVQYVGAHSPSDQQRAALEAGVMQVVCVTDADVRTPERLDRIAHKVAELLESPLPAPDDKWLSARKRLCRQVEVPTYLHMQLTLHDIEMHQSS